MENARFLIFGLYQAPLVIVYRKDNVFSAGFAIEISSGSAMISSGLLSLFYKGAAFHEPKTQ